MLFQYLLASNVAEGKPDAFHLQITCYLQDFSLFLGFQNYFQDMYVFLFFI